MARDKPTPLGADGERLPDKTDQGHPIVWVTQVSVGFALDEEDAGLYATAITLKNTGVFDDFAKHPDDAATRELLRDIYAVGIESFMRHKDHPLTPGEVTRIASKLGQVRPDELREAFDRSGMDISPCSSCGKPTVCVPEGLCLCQDCAE